MRITCQVKKKCHTVLHDNKYASRRGAYFFNDRSFGLHIFATLCKYTLCVIYTVFDNADMTLLL